MPADLPVRRPTKLVIV